MPEAFCYTAAVSFRVEGIYLTFGIVTPRATLKLLA